jgi:hypothetical protein
MDRRINSTFRIHVEFHLRDRIIRRAAKRWSRNGMAEFSPIDNGFVITELGASVYKRMNWLN